MRIELTADQLARQQEFEAFAAAQVAPLAGEIDHAERTPAALIGELAARGYLGALLPKSSGPKTIGGLELDWIAFGLLNEALGKACSSIRSLLTVHSMVSFGLLRWGSPALKERYLGPLAKGELLGAFCLTEPAAGSDSTAIESVLAETGGDDYALTGTKKWITYGEIADLYLVFAKLRGQDVALLVPRASSGVAVRPIRGMLGTRGSHLAEVRFEGCAIDRGQLLGRPGFGVTGVASSCLDVGRYSVAWGCVGLAQACLDASVEHARRRSAFGKTLSEHQLVRRLITDMVAGVRASKLLCLHAGYLKDQSDPRTLGETFLAKYVAAETAQRASRDAVQILGAVGCSSEAPVERFYRDAKVMEIIEGSREIQQNVIAEFQLQEGVTPPFSP